MSIAGFNVIVGSFKKNGSVYHAAITAPSMKDLKCKSSVKYRVLFSPPLQKTISFSIYHDNGRWVPDKRHLIDPWVADNIGSIIQFKILGLQDQSPIHN